MNIARFARKGLLILSTLVLLAGCGGGGGGADTTGGGGGGDGDGTNPLPDNTKALFQLSAIDRDGAAQQTGLNLISQLLNGASIQTVTGSILAINVETGETRTFTFEVEVDTSAFEVTTEVRLPLPPAVYDLYALIETPSGRQYVGVIPDRIILGTDNVVRFEAQPVLGDGIADVTEASQLVEFTFSLEGGDVTTLNVPRIEISIDGGQITRFYINKSADWSSLFLALGPGNYRFQIWMYDGTTLVGIPLDIMIEITADGAPVVVPIQVINTFTPEPDSNSSLFNLVIPGFIVDEVGGINKTEAVFALYDPIGIKLFEQIVTLHAVGSNYENLDPVVVPGFYQGTVTWTLYLSDISVTPKVPVAYCAQEITLAPTAQQTLLCNVHLLDRESPPEVQQPMLVVNTSVNGVPAAGVIISANGQAIGLTGSGEEGTVAGQLTTFLPVGTYTFTARFSEFGVTLSEQVTLQAGQGITTVDFDYIPPDAIAPVVTILQPAGATNNPEPLLSFESDEGGTVTVEVDGSVVATRQLDGSGTGLPLSCQTNPGGTPAFACSGGLGHLSDGEHMVSVEVTDAAGNAGGDSLEFMLDSTAPIVTIVSPVSGSIVSDQTPTLSFIAGESGTASVSVDTRDEFSAAVTGGVPYSRDVGPLGDGSHSIGVAVTDALGNMNLAFTQFSVDSTAPAVTITAPLDGTVIGDRTPTLTFVAGESGTASVSVDGRTAFSATVTGGVPYSREIGPLGDGGHRVDVVVSDALGNSGSATTRFTVDSSAPECAISSPVNGSLTNDTTPTLTILCADSGTASVSVDSGDEEFSAAVSGGVPYSTEIGPLSDGVHRIDVVVSDALGNASSTFTEFTVDSTAPIVRISSPVNGSLLNEPTVTLTFVSGESGMAGVSLDGGPLFSTTVSGGVPYSRDIASLGEGDHLIAVTVTDAAGNTSSAFVQFKVDTVLPVVHILAPVGTISERAPVLSFTTSEPGVVAVYVDGQLVPDAGNRVRLPQQSDGPHTLEVIVTDGAGNAGRDSVTFTVQVPTLPPPIQLDPQYFRRPTRRVDARIDLDAPLRVRIPSQEAIQVLAGNAERYLLYLRLGKVHCLYLGGQYNAHVGGVEVNELEWFRNFNSPVCGLGKYRAGDEVNVEKSIRARILFGDPKFDETHLRLFVDVLGPGVSHGRHGDHDDDDDHDDDHDEDDDD